MKKFAVLSFVVALLSAPSAFADGNTITIDQSKLYESPDNKVQQFYQNINIPKGQEKLNLTLTYYNGTQTMPGFKWLRINSSTMSYLTEKSFDNEKSLSVNVTGELGSGGNQMMVEAGGIKGSSFGWRLTTEAPVVLSLHPNTPQAGEPITVTGQNFCPDPADNVATLGGEPLTCLAATPTHLVFQIPATFKAGAGDFKLLSAGLDAGQLGVSVTAGSPILRGVSVPWIAPGYNLEIYGGPFAPDAAGNKVTIGPFNAQIVKAGVNCLTVVAPPGFAGNPWGVHQPIKVISNGVPARGNLTVNCYTGISF